MTDPMIPFDMDPRYPPRYRVVMKTDHDLPPDLLLGALSQTFSLDNQQAHLLALPILRHKMVPHGAYSQEIAEAKAFELNRLIMAHGRMLATSIEPCENRPDIIPR